ncbi:hypothetical protein BaRGS_00000229 [Batillaria attramentaria]|uniref:Uncharacterized protein n=1 Tax=Batillaria attramentaria TaxID=370345 RepID=A0ABD0MBJ7_9CAEN
MWAARGNRLTPLLVVTVLVLSYSVSSSAKRSRASRLSERRSSEVKQEENKDSERDVVSNTGHKSDFNVANENGESQCKGKYFCQACISVTGQEHGCTQFECVHGDEKIRLVS